MSTQIRTVDFAWLWADSPPAGINTPQEATLSFVPRYRTRPVLCRVRRFVFSVLSSLESHNLTILPQSKRQRDIDHLRRTPACDNTWSGSRPV